MHKLLLIALTTTALASPAWAQSATGIGVGTSISNSRSSSEAVAISGQGGAGGRAQASGNGNSSLTINSAAQPAVTTQNINTHSSGTVTERNVPAVFAPGLAAAGLETCLGSVSGGGSFVGTGFSFGSTIPDPGCAARLDARTLWSMGLKRAAIARLCLNPEINRSMPDVCGTYLPQPTVVGSGYYLSASATSSDGGPIMVVEGRTGRERLCNVYDSTKQRCRAWDGAVKPQHAKKHAPVVLHASAAQPTSVPPAAAIAEVTEGTAK